MRIRSIKPEFFRDSEVLKLSHSQRLLLIGLWCLADREGVFEYNLREIKSLILPDEKLPLAKIDAWLHVLVTHGFLTKEETTYTTYLNTKMVKKGTLCRVNGFDASYSIGKNERIRYQVVRQNEQNQPLYAVRGQEELGVRSKDLGPTEVGPKDIGERRKDLGSTAGTGPGSGPLCGPTRPASETKTKEQLQKEVDEYLAELRARK